MKTKIIEATNGPQNWGKFLVGRFTDEWQILSAAVEEEGARGLAVGGFDDVPLLKLIGHDPRHLLVFDLQTCEGAMFRPGGYAHADLEKHKIWVCPLFEPFLEWLYQQDLSDLDKLPALIDLPDAPFAMSGYRREGVIVDFERQMNDIIAPVTRAWTDFRFDQIQVQSTDIGDEEAAFTLIVKAKRRKEKAAV